MILYVIVGLPGSGKTHLGNELKKNIKVSTFIDDIDNVIKLYNAMELGGNIVISDPFLVEKSSRLNLEKIALAHGAEIRYFFFENDVDKCYNNVVNRKDGRIISRYFIEQLSQRYTIPEEYGKGLPIYESQSVSEPT